jgi:hypothetical protein
MADASRDAAARQVPTVMGRLQVTDHPGDEPALVLMHGFRSHWPQWDQPKAVAELIR